jgi:hypothetical protein
LGDRFGSRLAISAEAGCGLVLSFLIQGEKT